MKDLNSFLHEEDTDKTKPHQAKKDEEMNDKLYFALMDQYKQMRRTDHKSARKLLEKAMSMKGVSQKAKLGAAYL